MPIIHASIAAGRTDDQVEKFVEGVVKVASETLNAPESAVTVIVNQIPHNHLATNGVLKSKQ
ncbi:4-oxalocrotonate tautomerase [Corynebacterium renale]|uniref:4-oxalocrotonate tautomerase n=1 Tax=Corynebacterium renale TaxID=1724 RepID=A0A2A9DNM8_9CORY|nr:tautomerase family protein [Corynebacterium renale]PFG28204.1 4-oxalocrotonate tautomerase [Corynebacterium renale]SQG65209.1 4-oxalocrotonate tautomerase [Corynebacterium renale]SQI19747.1 4-oxalocrotonate tautomerase [Corynebacterium renale]STC98334.1 4-oxalocrotonate tautomerase [Corynebacterium renale]